MNSVTSSGMLPEMRLGIAGLAEENGHPFSWSAILNVFDRHEMSLVGYPMIHNYWSEFGIAGVRVTSNLTATTLIAVVLELADANLHLC